MRCAVVPEHPSSELCPHARHARLHSEPYAAYVRASPSPVAHSEADWRWLWDENAEERVPAGPTHLRHRSTAVGLEHQFAAWEQLQHAVGEPSAPSRPRKWKPPPTCENSRQLPSLTPRFDAAQSVSDQQPSYNSLFDGGKSSAFHSRSIRSNTTRCSRRSRASMSPKRKSLHRPPSKMTLQHLQGPCPQVAVWRGVSQDEMENHSRNVVREFALHRLDCRKQSMEKERRKARAWRMAREEECSRMMWPDFDQDDLGEEFGGAQATSRHRLHQESEQRAHVKVASPDLVVVDDLPAGRRPSTHNYSDDRPHFDEYEDVEVEEADVEEDREERRTRRSVLEVSLEKAMLGDQANQFIKGSRNKMERLETKSNSVESLAPPDISVLAGLLAQKKSAVALEEVLESNEPEEDPSEYETLHLTFEMAETNVPRRSIGAHLDALQLTDVVLLQAQREESAMASFRKKMFQVGLREGAFVFKDVNIQDRWCFVNVSGPTSELKKLARVVLADCFDVDGSIVCIVENVQQQGAPQNDSRMMMLDAASIPEPDDDNDNFESASDSDMSLQDEPKIATTSLSQDGSKKDVTSNSEVAQKIQEQTLSAKDATHTPFKRQPSVENRVPTTHGRNQLADWLNKPARNVDKISPLSMSPSARRNSLQRKEARANKLSRMRRLVDARRNEFNERTKEEQDRFKAAFAKGDRNHHARLDAKGIRVALADLGLGGRTPAERDLILQDAREAISCTGHLNFFDFIQLVPLLEQKIGELRSPKLRQEFVDLDTEKLGRIREDVVLKALEKHVRNKKRCDPDMMKSFWHYFVTEWPQLLHQRSKGSHNMVDFSTYQALAQELERKLIAFIKKAENRIAVIFGISATLQKTFAGQLGYLSWVFIEHASIQSDVVASLATSSEALEALLDAGIIPTAGDMFELGQAAFAQNKDGGLVQFAAFLSIINKLRDEAKVQLRSDIQRLKQTENDDKKKKKTSKEGRNYTGHEGCNDDDMTILVVINKLCLLQDCQVAPKEVQRLMDASQDADDHEDAAAAVGEDDVANQTGPLLEHVRHTARAKEAKFAKRKNLSKQQVFELRLTFAAMSSNATLDVERLKTFLQEINPEVEVRDKEVEQVMMDTWGDSDDEEGTLEEMAGDGDKDQQEVQTSSWSQRRKMRFFGFLRLSTMLMAPLTRSLSKSLSRLTSK